VPMKECNICQITRHPISRGEENLIPGAMIKLKSRAEYQFIEWLPDRENFNVRICEKCGTLRLVRYHPKDDCYIFESLPPFFLKYYDKNIKYSEVLNLLLSEEFKQYKIFINNLVREYLAAGNYNTQEVFNLLVEIIKRKNREGAPSQFLLSLFELVIDRFYGQKDFTYTFNPLNVFIDIFSKGDNLICATIKRIVFKSFIRGEKEFFLTPESEKIELLKITNYKNTYDRKRNRAEKQPMKNLDKPLSFFQLFALSIVSGVLILVFGLLFGEFAASATNYPFSLGTAVATYYILKVTIKLTRAWF